jgi:hypothetical protein
MAMLADELLRLREADPEVAYIMDTYSEIDRHYQAAVEAMGQRPTPVESVTNSAHVTISVTDQPGAGTSRSRDK